jgi:hypothetical protein
VESEEIVSPFGVAPTGRCFKVGSKLLLGMQPFSRNVKLLDLMPLLLLLLEVLLKLQPKKMVYLTMLAL